MDDHSDAFEREVLEFVREARGIVRTLRLLLILAASLFVVLLGLALFGLVFNRSTGSSSPADAHAPFTQGASLATRTGDGQYVTATILDMTWAQGPVLTVRVTGADPARLPAVPWTFVLEDGQVLALESSGPLDAVSVRFSGSLPGGSKVRFVHFDPDGSHGDIYFDVH